MRGEQNNTTNKKNFVCFKKKLWREKPFHSDEVALRRSDFTNKKFVVILMRTFFCDVVSISKLYQLVFHQLNDADARENVGIDGNCWNLTPKHIIFILSSRSSWQFIMSESILGCDFIPRSTLCQYFSWPLSL